MGSLTDARRKAGSSRVRSVSGASAPPLSQLVIGPIAVAERNGIPGIFDGHLKRNAHGNRFAAGRNVGIVLTSMTSVAVAAYRLHQAEIHPNSPNVAVYLVQQSEGALEARVSSFRA